MLAAFLAAAQQASAVPPPLVQLTANCAQPVYATDMLVCGDPALKARDLRLAAMLDAKARDAPVVSPLLENQEAWFRRSRRCAFETDQRSCVEAAYDDRLAVLSAPSISGRDVGSCRLRDGGVIDFVQSGAAFALRSNGETIAVGIPASTGWRPFLTYNQTGRRATIRDLAGDVVATCRINPKGMPS